MHLSESLYKSFLPLKTFNSVWICQLKNMPFLFWPKTGQDWPSMTQMKKLCHSCWFWARQLVVMHSYRTVISSNPSAYFSFCCPCFQVPSTTHWMIIFSKFSPSHLLSWPRHFGSIGIGRQNAGCHIFTLPIGLVVVVTFRSLLTHCDPWYETIPPASVTFNTVEY